MTGCLQVAFSFLAVIINAVTLGKTMRPHRLTARTLASHAGNEHPSRVTPQELDLSLQAFKKLFILRMV